MKNLTVQERHVLNGAHCYAVVYEPADDFYYDLEWFDTPEAAERFLIKYRPLFEGSHHKQVAYSFSCLQRIAGLADMILCSKICGGWGHKKNIELEDAALELYWGTQELETLWLDTMLKLIGARPGD